MFGTLGGPELFLIFVVALIVFGPRKLPEIGKSLGKMMSEFRRASNDFRSTIESEVESEKIRESMRIEPPKVKKVETTSGTPSGGAGDSETSSESGDTSEDADAEGPNAASGADAEGPNAASGADAEGPKAASGADGEGSGPQAASDTEDSATPGDTGQPGSDDEGVPSTVSRQPPLIEPK